MQVAHWEAHSGVTSTKYVYLFIFIEHLMVKFDQDLWFVFRFGLM